MRRLRVRPRIILAIVAILAMALLPALWRLMSVDWVDDAYALWGAGEMVVNHMEDHEGRWPRGWDDLRPYFDAGGGRVGGWSFDEYQRHVTIRWDVDPVAPRPRRGEPRGHSRGDRGEGMACRLHRRPRA